VAACFAAAELLLPILIGGYFDRDRADLLPFLAWRPLLVLILLLALRGLPWRLRAAGVVLGLVIAALGEAVLVARLGGAIDWAMAARGLAGGLALALLLDVVLGGGLRIGRGRWRGAASVAIGLVLCLVLLGLPGFGPAALYGRFISPSPQEPRAQAPIDLLVATGLPLIWGEGDPLSPTVSPEMRPARAYAQLAPVFAPRPIDAIDPGALGGRRLLLLAQPRPPGPAALAAIDDWVRGGGRVLILTDPDLRWPTGYALGDARRPPTDDGLGPLLAHWGLSLSTGGQGGVAVRDIGARRIVLAAPGRLAGQESLEGQGDCAVSKDGLIARCAIGKGRAIVVADADWLADGLWTGPGRQGGDSAFRLADNAAWLRDLLLELADRRPVDAPVAWIAAGAARTESVAIGLLPALMALLAAIGLIVAGTHAKPRAS